VKGSQNVWYEKKKKKKKKKKKTTNWDTFVEFLRPESLTTPPYCTCNSLSLYENFVVSTVD
jgi:hypothetical protein